MHTDPDPSWRWRGLYHDTRGSCNLFGSDSYPSCMQTVDIIFFFIPDEIRLPTYIQQGQTHTHVHVNLMQVIVKGQFHLARFFVSIERARRCMVARRRREYSRLRAKCAVPPCIQQRSSMSTNQSHRPSDC
ncbi:hypothetical protein ABW21_db0202781 [Orbilia brochopaga]|nr:hypothetical protein ABW21_db0202781 [Drechslerella brochopaga]